MALLSYDDLNELHSGLYARFQKYNIQLQPVIKCESSASLIHNGNQVIAYLRPTEEAQTVESMMGRDLPSRRLDVRRHPVIELRATDDALILELVVAPDAWWDQQNLAGKIALERQRSDFRRMIARLDDSFRLGFWHGMELDSTHLTAKQASHPAIFDQWVSTFSDGKDWFRIGAWYEQEQLESCDLITDLFDRAQKLYEIYNFIAWNSNNDFRMFYQRQPFAYA